MGLGYSVSVIPHLSAAVHVDSSFPVFAADIVVLGLAEMRFIFQLLQQNVGDKQSLFGGGTFCALNAG